MSGAREEILAEIRKSLGRGSLDSAAAGELDRRMVEPPLHPRPQVREALVERFVDKLTSVTGTVARVGNLEDVPGAVSEYLQQQGLPAKLRVAPVLRDQFSWPGGIEVQSGIAEPKDVVSLTPCFAAVAETGTLVLLSSPDSPTTLNFLPEDHIVVVRSEQFVRYLEDIWPLLRALPDGMPRTVNLISGPSKTADVEQTIQYGAHGPRRLHVIVVGDGAVRVKSGAAPADRSHA